MARKTSAAIAAPTTPKDAPVQGPREQNPRRRRGRKGHRRGRRHRNPKKNLGYGAKVGIAIGALVIVGGGGYLAYRHFKKPGVSADVQAKLDAAQAAQDLVREGVIRPGGY